MLTADMVAAAIVAASREVGADPIKVARGDQDTQSVCAHGNPTLARARRYAVMALREALPGVHASVLARSVGVRNRQSAGVFVSLFRKELESGRVRWWDDKAARRVLAAVRVVPTASVPLAVAKLVEAAPARVQPRAPFRMVSDEDRRPGGVDPLARRAVEAKSLRDQLAEAVRNTAALPIGGGKE